MVASTPSNPEAAVEVAGTCRVTPAPTPAPAAEPVATTPTTPTTPAATTPATSDAGGNTCLMGAAKTAHMEFLVWLNESHGCFFDTNIAKLEACTGMKRERLVYAAFATLALYLVAGSGAQIACNLIGFGYPVYASVKAVRSQDKADDTQWLVYWTVFATFSLVDFFAESICQWFPVYWLAKALFLVFLYLPQTRGAEILYAKGVDPLVTRIDCYLAKKQQ